MRRKVRISTYNFTEFQLKVLITIKQAGDGQMITQTFLAKKLNVRLSSVKRAVDRLILEGLLEVVR